MLEIQEKLSDEGYDELRASVGEGLHITEALDGERVIGFIAYVYHEKETVIHDYDDGDDLMLCDGLVRSVFFKSCLKGIETVVFSLPDSSKYENLRKLRFIPKDGFTAENIDSFMNGCENCKHSSS